MSKYAHLTDTWVKEYNEGKSIREIARMYEVDKTTVKRNIAPYIEQRPQSPTRQYAEKWKELYEEGWSQGEIASKYKVSKFVVSKRLQELGVESRHQGGGREPEFDMYLKEWIKLYEEDKWSLRKIAKQYNCAVSTVSNVLSKEIERRSYSESSRVYKLDESYFTEINTKEKAYWLGFMFASGFLISRPAAYPIEIAVSGQDESHILAFVEAISSDAVIIQREDGLLHSRFHSEIMSKDLQKWGMSYKKFQEMRMPTFKSTSLTRSFILGYVDGKSSMGTDRITLAIVGVRDFLLELNGFIKKELGIAFNVKELKSQKSEHYYQLSSFSKYKVMTFYNWLYEDQPVKLQRKEEKYKQYQKMIPIKDSKSANRM